MIRSRTLPMALVAAMGVVAAVMATEPPGDPWIGKARADLEELLGPPTVERPGKDGGVRWTYKLVRLAEGELPPLGTRVLTVPGVEGPVGRTIEGATLHPDSVSLNASDADSGGRSTAVSGENETASIHWNPRTGERTVTSSEDDQSGVRGKLTLKFELSPAGEIRSWSVAPRKARAKRGR